MEPTTICECKQGDGCYRCCTLCNIDRHICPGCGKDLNHGIDVCLRCRNR